ncbi:NAD(P)-binding domain-containing protein [Streptomyces sp. NPDC094472]|uniref:NAD(P)-dependent oxidoreductase n=1 Tax=unclassified Streptomyces TaxID=2593676 RepID=UPI00332C900B
MKATPQAVTVVGLGSMGSALAAALLDRGHPTTVWNRSAHKAQPLVDRGAHQAATLQQAIAASPLTITCLLDYEALHTVFDPVADALAGKSLINLTSGTPDHAHQAAVWARSHDADYLDGAIMTTPPGIGSPEMMVLYSGSPATFEAHRDTLTALGDPLHLGTDPGAASLYDAALLGLMWATMTGWLHATALVGTEKTPATAFTPVAIRWLTAVEGFLTRYAPQVDAGHYPGDDATVDVQIAAIDHLIHTGASRGIDNALPELLKAALVRARAAGHGSDSFASVIEVLKNPAGDK